MPELPEVETIRRGLVPHLQGRRIVAVIIREHRLRWPIAPDFETQVVGATIETIERRAKYLLLHLTHGTVIIHLGMSGSIRVLMAATPPQLHDHIDLILETNQCLRLRDPRRFGAMLWHTGLIDDHSLLHNLGPEPLTANFNGNHLAVAAKNRRVAIKLLIMDSHVVAGVGNIYASESLFVAGIHPQLSCRDVTIVRYNQLALAIQQVLTQAIAQGGTTLRDFMQTDGQPGYFANSLQVYGRANMPCLSCGNMIQELRIGQRMSFFCPGCQH